MTPEPKQSSPSPTPSSASSAAPAFRRPLPVWLIILLFILLYWGMVYFDTQGGWQPIVYRPYHSVDELALYQPPPRAGPNLDQGSKVFDQDYGLCHNNDESGNPVHAP